MKYDLPESVRQPMADIAVSDLIRRMPISDEEACAWANIRQRLYDGDILGCSRCGFKMDYKRGEVWILAQHIVSHGVRIVVGS